MEWINRNSKLPEDSALVLIATKGLFHRAIAESGSRLERRNRDLAEAEKDGVKFAAAKGATSIRELRALPAKDLPAVACASVRSLMVGSCLRTPTRSSRKANRMMCRC